MQTVRVTASKNYDIIIGKGIIKDIGAYALGAAGIGKAAIITDSNVDPLHAGAVEKALMQAGYRTCKFVFPAGEASKNTDTLVSILNFLAENRLERTDTVFALGGGVTGDMAGFAASVYLRGIRLIQLPTTLLAAVDSSVGGKTAVDLPSGKNMAGTFFQPNLVLCDISLLDTLPPAVFTDGCAEVIKYGILADKELFSALKNGIRSQLEDVIARCVQIKSRFVAQDEHDTGLRRLLNLGHTAAHAIEMKSGYSVSHGSAVAIGTVIAARAAAKTGRCKMSCCYDIVEMMKLYGLPVSCTFSAEELYDGALSDKKRADGRFALVMPEEIGKCSVFQTDGNGLSEFMRLGSE